MTRGEEYVQGPLKETGGPYVQQDAMPLSHRHPSALHPGLYFQDGLRRVDYVLTYDLSGPCNGQESSNGDKPSCLQRLRCCKDPEASIPESLSRQVSQENMNKAYRADFEGKLEAVGLQLEKDEESDVGFLKIYATWDVLCREAEFLKLKLPTKAEYQVKPSSGRLRKKISEAIDKITAPLKPDVEDNSSSNVKKNICYPFSREKQHLFELSESVFDSKTRSLIVYEVIKRTKCSEDMKSMGINSLFANGIYTAAYPLHDGDIDGENVTPNDRMVLYESWASYTAFYKFQPIGLIRKYFGEKIALYFAWLGLYTQMLLLASVVGVLAFLYGCMTVDSDIPSMEICDKRNNITMCPLCVRVCSYWKLKAACGTARASHLFDNTATVLFSVFMALWATMFMEHWKRTQMRLNCVWDLANFEEDEELAKDHERIEYKVHVLKKTERKERKSSRKFLVSEEDNQNQTTENGQRDPKKKNKLTWRDRFPAYITFILMMLLMFLMTFAIVFGVILYRVTTQAALQMNPDTRTNVRLTVQSTAVIINLVVILILDEVYAKIARWLTILEVPKTDRSFEQRLVMKTFILKFLNAFSPIVYIAFFRGKIVGRPGNYLFIYKFYRMEECAHTGCLMELCIQLSIIMLGKQLIQNNLFEIGIPRLKKLIKRLKRKQNPAHRGEHRKLQRYEKDNSLDPFEGLNPEYMEMIIQYGFVTLFVASFPLAPLFALLNNVIEIRLDAKKFVAELRRPLPVRAKDIGIWYNILRGISKVAVVVNAFVIAFTSDFIPRLCYQYMYSPDGTMHGFINHSLSYFNVSHFQNGSDPLNPMQLGYPVEVCRYKDHRNAPWGLEPYELTKKFWAILAARLGFVIIFQNVVMLMSDFVDWVIPDIPKEISSQIQEEKVRMVKFFMREEQVRMGDGGTETLYPFSPGQPQS